MSRPRSLSQIIVDELLRALGTIARSGGICSIVVEQHAQKILGLIDRVVILERSEIVRGAVRAEARTDLPCSSGLGVAGKS